MTQDIQVQPARIPLTKSKKITVIVAMMLAGFVPLFATTARMIILPSVLASLNAMHLYAMVSIFAGITMSVMLPIAGKLGDLFGRKAMVLISGALFVVSCIIITVSTNGTIFIVGCALSGIAYGITSASTNAIIADITTSAERPKIIGYTQMVNNATGLVAPIAAGVLADTLGWRWVYYPCIPLFILVMIMVMTALPKITRDPNAPKPYIDVKGLLLFLISLPPLLLLIGQGGSMIPWISPLAFILAGVSIIGLILLIVVENHSKEPMIPTHLFKSGAFAKVFCISLLAYISSASVMYYSVYTQNVHGMSATLTGVMQMPRGIISIFVGGIVGGIIAKKQNFKSIYLVELALVIVGCVPFIFLTPGSSPAIFVAAIIIFGLGMGGMMVCSLSLMQKTVPMKDMGAAMSLVIFTGSFGASLGAAIASPIINGTWSRAASVIPDSLKNILSADNYSALLNQSTLGSAETIEAIRASVGVDLQGVFDTTIYALREQLMQGIRLINIVCIGCVALALVLALTLPRKKTADNL